MSNRPERPVGEFNAELQEWIGSLTTTTVPDRLAMDGIRRAICDDLRVIGEEELEPLVEFSGYDLTGFEFAYLISLPIMIPPYPRGSENSRLILANLIDQGVVRKDLVKEGLAVLDIITTRGLHEAKLMLDELIPDPVTAASGHELLDTYIDSF